MNQDPLIEYSLLIENMRRRNEAFVLATVIQVHGSASARVGAKAVFDRAGQNIFGWVGGGCAERFIGEQAVESLKAEATRTVLADLDDEVFGLGVACGGKMEVFLDPILPLEKVQLTLATGIKTEAEKFITKYGLRCEDGGNQVNSLAQFFSELAKQLAHQRGTTGRSLREVRDLPTRFGKCLKTFFPVRTQILGRGRIVEALEDHFAALGWRTEVIPPDRVEEATLDFDHIVVVASHSSRDPRFVERALANKASYVGMIGSRKRALEVNSHLKIDQPNCPELPLYLPGGIDLDACNPYEIALSLTAEILKEML